MRELKKFLERAMVLVLTVALVSNSVELWDLHVQAESPQNVSLSVSDNEAQGSVSSNQATFNLSFRNGSVLETSEYVDTATDTVAELTVAGTTTPYGDIKTALNAATTKSGSTLKLLQNVELKEDYSVGGTFTLDLNNCTLDMGSSVGNDLTIAEATNLIICDNSNTKSGKIAGRITNIGTLILESGAIIGGEGHAVNNSGVFVMEGGTLEGSVGVANDFYAEFTMTGGTIQNCNNGVDIQSEATFTMTGGIIRNMSGIMDTGNGVHMWDDAIFIMDGGTIQDCDTNGVVNRGNFTMSGGTIQDCGFAGVGNSASFTLTGGSISGEQYGIRTGELFLLSGNPTISTGENGVELLVFAEEMVTIAGALNGTDTYEVAIVDLSAQDTCLAGVFAQGSTQASYTISATDATKFISADTAYKVEHDTVNNQLMLASAVHEHDGITTPWEDADKEGGIAYSLVGGSYYLTQNVTETVHISIRDDVTICLNGYTLDLGESDIDIYEEGTLTICDCSRNETGKIVSSYKWSTISNEGTFVLESGSIENVAGEEGDALINWGGTAKIQGGMLSSEDGYCIAVHGGSLELSGNPIMNGAEDTKDIAVEVNESIVVSGALTGTEPYVVYAAYAVPGVFAQGTDDYILKNSDVEMFELVLDDYFKIVHDEANNQLRAEIKTIDITVQYIWEDDNDLWGARPDSITTSLLENGAATVATPQVLPNSPSWTYTYVDMPVITRDWYDITYELEKNWDIDKYKWEIEETRDEESGDILFTVTMRYTQPHEFYFQEHEGGSVEVLCVSRVCDCVKEFGKVSIAVPEPQECYYDGDGKEAEVVLSEDNHLADIGAAISDIVYYNEDGTPLADGEVPVNVGAYEAQATITLTDGQNTTVSKTFEIYKSQMSGVIVTPYEGTYEPPVYDGVNNVKEAVTVEGAPNGARVQYSIDGGITWSDTVPTISETGVLTVQVKVISENYEDYTEEVQAEICRYNLETGYGSWPWVIGLENQDVFYYTGEEVTPVMQRLDTVNHSMNLDKFVENVDYLVSYSNNLSVAGRDSENPPTITIQGIGNYEGSISTPFAIQYYDGTVTPLYNGSATEENMYGDDVVISAEGYTVSESLNGTYTDSVTISGEGINVSKTLYFKQQGTGYITDGYVIDVNIDKSGPVFGDNQGIQIEDSFWNMLLDKVTFGKVFKETKQVEITATDAISGVDSYYYYLDTTGSETALTSVELDVLREAGKFVADADGSFLMEDDSKYVIYAYAKDAVGNRSGYICSDGVILDSVASVLEVTVPTEAADTLADTEMTFVVESNEDGFVFVSLATGITGSEQLDQLIAADENMFSGLQQMEDDELVVLEDETLGLRTIGYKTTLTAGEAKEITITGLTPNTLYEYGVIAFDAAGNGTVFAGAENAENPGNYETLQITTLKTMPVFNTLPLISGVYGQNLGEMTLTAPTTSTNGVAGVWSLADGDKGVYPAVNGEEAYIVTFTPTDTDKYATITKQVVPTVEKKPITVSIDNQTVKYNEQIPAFTCTVNGMIGNDITEDLNIQLSTTAVKGSNAGVYSITGTANAANYAVTFTNATLTIEKLDTVITVESGKESYAKTFGNLSFKMDGISLNSDATLQYIVKDSKDLEGNIVADNEVVIIDAEGKVTMVGTGSATIRVEAPETINYRASVTDISVNVGKATIQDVIVDRSYSYVRENSDSLNLKELIPTDAGKVDIVLGTVTGNFTQEPAFADKVLNYTLADGEVGDTATVTVEVSSDHYENFDIILKLELTDQKPVIVKPGMEVTAAGELIYGQSLGELAFAEVVFVDEITGAEVAGKLAWQNPDEVLSVADTKASWVFTPDSEKYLALSGEADIVVKQAEQPKFSIVPLTGLQYSVADVETIAVETNGGIVGGKVTITAPENNGVIIFATENSFRMQGAGTVVITAVSHDPSGNYKDAVATYELMIAPDVLLASNIHWEEGITGVETYDGKEKIPTIWIYSIAGPLTEGVDYTVEYINNIDVYTLAESDAGFDAEKAPAVVVTGIGNYTGVVEKFFVIQQAENVPNISEPSHNDGVNTGNAAGSTVTGTPFTTQTVISPETADNNKIEVCLLALASVLAAGMLLVIKRRKENIL